MKKYQTLETIATILWLLMDFVWMCGFNLTAAVMSVPTLFILVMSSIKFQGNKISELHSMNASVGWLLMNSMWIFSEIVDKDKYLLCAKLSFLFAVICVLLSLRASRKEKEIVDFKRLKIK